MRSWCSTGTTTPSSALPTGAVIIENLMQMDMDYEDAVDFFEFNIAGAIVGPDTPVIQFVEIAPATEKLKEKEE
jgi:hypothetical protein